jgi:hypothetical protein
MKDEINFSDIEKICKYAIKDWGSKIKDPDYEHTGIACRGFFGPEGSCVRSNPCVATKFYWTDEGLEVKTDLWKMGDCSNREPK